MTGSREGSWELVAVSTCWCQPLCPLSGAAAHGWVPVRRDRAPGGAREAGPSIVHIPSHLPPLHLPKLDIAMKKD